MATTTSSFKREIMMKLANDPRIFELINNPNIDPDNPDDLIYVNIFPYLKVNYTIQEVGTFIGVKLDYPVINSNEIWKDAEMTISIICANGAMKADGGLSRTDLISERIIELLQWNGDYGCRIELISEKENPVDENFYYRKLVFGFFAPNGMKNGVKVNI